MTILTVERGLIAPSLLNPRKHFPDQPLNELALNIRNVGIVQALVVREREPGFNPEFPAAKYELVAGERRWRASDERPHPNDGAAPALPALETLPVVVRELTDTEVMELMLSENMQRRDLSPVEEMEAFSRILAEGQHSFLSLAEKIGVSESYVRQRLQLRKLTKVGRRALEDGSMGVGVARAICGCPEEVVPLVEDEVLNPKKYDRWKWQLDEVDGSLNEAQTYRVIHESYVRQLRGAPFDTTKPLLGIETNAAGERMSGGACTDCPWNTANQKERPERAGLGRVAGEGRFCLNPKCFARKVELNVAAELARAENEGLTVLKGEEAKKALSYQSSYVELNDKPAYADLTEKALESGKVPAWKTLIKGESAPPVVVVVDEAGKVHKLVERSLAIAAAKANGKAECLKGGNAQSMMELEAAASRKKEADAAKEKRALSHAVMAAVMMQLQERQCFLCYSDPALLDDTNRFWRAMAPLAIRHAGEAGRNYVCRRRGIEKQPTSSEALAAVLEAKTGADMWGLVVELLLAEPFAFSEGPYSPCVVPSEAGLLLEYAGVDVKRVEATLKEDAKAAAKAKEAKKGKGKGKKDWVKPKDGFEPGDVVYWVRENGVVEGIVQEWNGVRDGYESSSACAAVMITKSPDEDKLQVSQVFKGGIFRNYDAAFAAWDWEYGKGSEGETREFQSGDTVFWLRENRVVGGTVKTWEDYKNSPDYEPLVAEEEDQADSVVVCVTTFSEEDQGHLVLVAKSGLFYEEDPSVAVAKAEALITPKKSKKKGKK